jgi:hypothetical protein
MAALLDALETSTWSTPKNVSSDSQSSIRNEVMKTGPQQRLQNLPAPIGARDPRLTRRHRL